MVFPLGHRRVGDHGIPLNPYFHSKGLFEHEIDTIGSFQGSGYVFAKFVLRKIKTRPTLKKFICFGTVNRP